MTYNSQAAVYLAAWNNRTDGGLYTRRYSPVLPPTATAQFNAAPLSGVVPLTVTFTDTTTGTITNRSWDFGDNTPLVVTTSVVLTHTYLATGTFTATLTVTNPAGSAITTTLITVTEQITPNLSADFEALDLGSDPTFWLDQLWDTTARDDFETLWADDSRALATTYTGNVVYSHYAIPGWTSWQNYEYRGRMKMSDPGGGIGLAFYSRYPANEQNAYILRRYAGTAQTERFHLTAFGSSLQGDTDLGLTPQANTWYRFRIQAVTHSGQITLRARVWAEGETEPLTWQAEAYDSSATRLTTGAVGVRTQGAGAKYFDDLAVTPLAIQADFSISVRSGFIPFSPVFTATPLGQVLTYTWNFGDGSPPVVTTSVVSTHPYTQTGVYTVSLKVDGPAGTDTLTRSAYIIAADLATELRGHWRLEEASGQRLDSSGYGNHLTETNTVASATGQVDQAADLERGSNEYLSLAHALQNGLAITGSLSLAGWVRLESLNPNNSMVVAGKYEFGVNNRAYRLDIGPDGTPAFIVSPDGTGSADYNLVATTALTINTWYHLAAVFDSHLQTLSLYLDGAPVGTRSIAYNTIYPSTAPFMLGTNLNNGSAAQFYDGLLDEWRVYARALSQAEIQGLMVTTPPTVNFSAAPLSGPAPLTVVFTNTTTGPATYLWNFSASSSLPPAVTSTLINPAHTYTQSGVYTVSLAATGPGGSASLTKTNYITVSAVFTQNWGMITTSVAPPLHGEQAMAYDTTRNRLVVYGGNTPGWPYARTTREFDGTTWYTMTTTLTPTARYGAAMAYDNVRGVMILFGGSTAGDLALNQTWRYTNTTWNQVTITGTIPASRTYASMAAGASGQLYLFGGNNGTTYYDDLWRYNNGAWTQLNPATSPPARTLAALAYDPANNRLLLFGGRTASDTLLADLWAFNLSTSTWSQFNAPGGPSARMAHTLTYYPATNSVVLVGGTTNNGITLLGDTWHYQAGWTQVYPATPLPGRAYHQTVYGSNALILFSNGEVWQYE